jgi:hypothetical protein
MNVGVVKGALALAATSTLVAGLTLRYRRRRTIGSALQLMGAVFFAIVAVTHVFEALAILPSLGWGQPRSIGHYIDLGSAVAGIALFAAGFWSTAHSRD